MCALCFLLPLFILVQVNIVVLLQSASSLVGFHVSIERNVRFLPSFLSSRPSQLAIVAVSFTSTQLVSPSFSEAHSVLRKGKEKKIHFVQVPPGSLAFSKYLLASCSCRTSIRTYRVCMKIARLTGS